MKTTTIPNRHIGLKSLAFVVALAIAMTISAVLATGAQAEELIHEGMTLENAKGTVYVASGQRCYIGSTAKKTPTDVQLRGIKNPTNYVSFGKGYIALRDLGDKYDKKLTLTYRLNGKKHTLKIKAMSLENVKGTLTILADRPSGFCLYSQSYRTTPGTITGLACRKNVLDCNPAQLTTGNVTSGYLEIFGKKPGTSKLSYKYRGKTHTLKVQVRKWQNPFLSFKIGSTENKAQFKKYESGSSATLRGKVKIKLAKNWVLLDIRTNYGTKSVKNGSKVDLDDGTLSAIVMNKKTKAVRAFYLDSPTSW